VSPVRYELVFIYQKTVLFIVTAMQTSYLNHFRCNPLNKLSRYGSSRHCYEANLLFVSRGPTGDTVRALHYVLIPSATHVRARKSDMSPCRSKFCTPLTPLKLILSINCNCGRPFVVGHRLAPKVKARPNGVRI
jgi:hypothetical protein